MPTITVTTTNEFTMPEYGAYLDISQLVDYVKRSGSHFFDKDTMRFFRSRVDDYVFSGPDGWYFVTSEKHESAFARINEPRAYTVRRLSWTDDHSDLRLYELFGFQAFPTLNRARTAARRAAKVGVGLCVDCRLHLTYSDTCHECQARRDRKAS